MMLNKLVMVIDDNPLQLAAISQKLRSLGLNNVKEFQYPRDAIEKIAKYENTNNIVIFCDLLMPRLDGIDTMILLEDKNFSGSVVLMSTADKAILDSVRMMCKSFGFDVIAEIVKPFITVELKRIIRMVRGSTTVDSSKAGYEYDSYSITENDILCALAQGEIKNYYQPLVDINNEKVVSVEALARWEHPKYGILTPIHFIDVINKCKLSQELFDVVLKDALQSISKKLIGVPVAINVDKNNIEDPSFSSNFLDLCNQYRVNPSLIKIEITERDSYSHSFEMYKNLAKLRMQSIVIAIDDFGTGYSSLQKLALLPFNELKIDKSVVIELDKCMKRQQIISHVTRLAKSLGMTVVAEGVENRQVVEFLKRNGVDLCQGFYFYKPMPTKALAKIDGMK